MNNTPETDAVLRSRPAAAESEPWSDHLIDLARRLELERDEARYRLTRVLDDLRRLTEAWAGLSYKTAGSGPYRKSLHVVCLHCDREIEPHPVAATDGESLTAVRCTSCGAMVSVAAALEYGGVLAANERREQERMRGGHA